MIVLKVWAAICNDPDAEKLRWSTPKVIGKDVMMNKPIVLSSGEWLFSMAVWREGVYVIREAASKNNPKLSFIYRTEDHGKSFICLGGADVPNRSFDEHMVIELKDGSLLMLVRTFYGIGKSYSYDKGKTWTPGEDSTLGGPCSRFHIRRLSSGNILLINHYNYQGRNNLTAMISRDECKTWEGYLVLDERSSVSYPDAVEGNNGYIYITYDHERGALYSDNVDHSNEAKEILMAKFTEEDVLAGKLVNKESRLKQIISKL